MIIGSNIIRFEELSSTNSQAAMLVKSGETPEGTVIVASYQTRGRGQAGSRWESDEGKNLLFSIILYPASVFPGEQFSISVAVSLGISDFLDGKVSGCRIKWPNDIYIGNDKIAGMLIENTLIGEKIESCIAGIGININQETFSDLIPNPVSLKLITGIHYDTEACLTDLLNNLDLRYRELLYGDREKIRMEYISRLFRLNEYHSFKTGNNMFKARITGISGPGLLIIEKDDGAVAEYSFKEIDYVR